MFCEVAIFTVIMASVVTESAFQEHLQQSIKHFTAELLRLEQFVKSCQAMSALQSVLQGRDTVQRQRLHEHQHHDLPLGVLKKNKKRLNFLASISSLGVLHKIQIHKANPC